MAERPRPDLARLARDRKSTRLNSSHMSISYAVFCLKKKKKNPEIPRTPPTTMQGILHPLAHRFRYVRCVAHRVWLFYFFFFNDTATAEIYTLSLHGALPILAASARPGVG